ncbi:MAG: hypothetical protein PHR66_02035 [Desulfuromonadaceae bacterium]|nr:hypothetical protein [Desulfuromonadaceae bacterium]
MLGNAMTVTEQVMLEKCREIELLCKELYDYFAELYSDNEDAVRLWRKTAMEEQNHADQFTLALKLRKDLPCTVLTNSTRIESVISQLRAVITKVKAVPPNLADALNASIKLEKHLAEFHIDSVARFENDSYRKMFNAMMSSDNEHIETLQQEHYKLTNAKDAAITGLY